MPYTLDQTPSGGIHLKVAAPRLPLLPVAAGWLVLWILGLYYAVFVIIDTGSQWSSSAVLTGFLLFWVVLWLVPGVIIGAAVLWGYFGREVIETDPAAGTLTLRRQALGVGPVRTLPLGGRFRFRPVRTGVFQARSKWSILGLGAGKIKYTGGGRSRSFGLGLSDTVAMELCRQLNDRSA